MQFQALGLALKVTVVGAVGGHCDREACRSTPDLWWIFEWRRGTNDGPNHRISEYPIMFRNQYGDRSKSFKTCDLPYD